MEKYFSRARSAQDIVVSVMFIVLGILLIVFPFSKMSGVVGCFMILIGVSMLFVLRSVYKDKFNGECFRKTAVFFPIGMKDEVVKAMEEGNLDTIPRPKDDMAAQSLMLSTFYDKDADRVFLQLFEYIPYSYRPCTTFYETRWHTVKHLVE